MIRYEIFDGKKTYMFPNGEVATPEKIRQKFPAVDKFPHILELNGDVCQAVMNLKAVRNIHKIDPALTDEEAIAQIENKVNNPPEPLPSPEERQAAALEFQNVLALPDSTDNEGFVKEDVVEDNVKKGLWSKAHLNVLVKKGLLTTDKKNKLVGKYDKVWFEN